LSPFSLPIPQHDLGGQALFQAIFKIATWMFRGGAGAGLTPGCAMAAAGPAADAAIALQLLRLAHIQVVRYDTIGRAFWSVGPLKPRSPSRARPHLAASDFFTNFRRTLCRIRNEFATAARLLPTRGGGFLLGQFEHVSMS